MFVVAFDGGDLSSAALERAAEFGEATGDEVVAMAVVPGDPTYAVEQEWVDSEREFDQDTVARELRAAAREVVPGVRFRAVRADSHAGAYAIGKRLRRAVREAGADVVFLGSENAGRVVTPVASVASGVATGGTYDVHIVRTV